MLPGSAEGADISQIGMSSVFPDLDIYRSAKSGMRGFSLWFSFSPAPILLFRHSGRIIRYNVQFEFICDGSWFIAIDEGRPNRHCSVHLVNARTDSSVSDSHRDQLRLIFRSQSILFLDQCISPLRLLPSPNLNSGCRHQYPTARSAITCASPGVKTGPVSKSGRPAAPVRAASAPWLAQSWRGLGLNVPI